MARPTAKDCHTLTSYYIKAWKERYHREPVVNRHSARWGFESVLMGMPVSEAKKLIDFYLTTESQKQHSLDWFFYNYDKLIDSLSDLEKDRLERERLREESRKRAEEWKARGNRGLEG